jgi:hypothetical protein
MFGITTDSWAVGNVIALGGLVRALLICYARVHDHIFDVSAECVLCMCVIRTGALHGYRLSRVQRCGRTRCRW